MAVIKPFHVVLRISDNCSMNMALFTHKGPYSTFTHGTKNLYQADGMWLEQGQYYSSPWANLSNLLKML